MSVSAAELRDLVGDVMAGRDRPRDVQDSVALWAQIQRLGLAGIGIAEDRGGSGGTLGDLVVVIDALGEHGVSVPIIEASVARWIDGNVSFGTVSTAPMVTVEDGVLSTRVNAVPWARAADRLFLCGASKEVVAIDLHDESVTVCPAANLAGDPRDAVVLERTPATVVEEVPADAVRARLDLLWASAIDGALRGAYQMTKDHVAQRHQFGAPLIKIPAVASALATMRVQLIQADAALQRALRVITNDPQDTAAVAVARVTAATAASEVARLAHQLHGAIGITSEHLLHHYTRRLWAWRDTVTAQHEAADLLGRLAIDSGEAVLWTHLTAW